MEKVTARDLFNKWVGILRKNQDLRYTHAERPSLLEELFVNFKSEDITYEEAKMFRRDAMEALTTEEGRKGKGRHKGWKEACFTDFDSILANMYIEDVTEEEREELVTNKYRKPVDTGIEVAVLEVVGQLEEDEAIREWAKNKYGEHCTEEIICEAHRLGGELYLQFIQDVI